VHPNAERHGRCRACGAAAMTPSFTVWGAAYLRLATNSEEKALSFASVLQPELEPAGA